MSKFVRGMGSIMIMIGTVLGVLSFDSYGYGYLEFDEWVDMLLRVWIVPVYIGIGLFLLDWLVHKAIDVIQWYGQYQDDMAMLEYYIEREEKHRKFRLILEMIDLSRENEDNYGNCYRTDENTNET